MHESLKQRTISLWIFIPPCSICEEENTPTPDLIEDKLRGNDGLTDFKNRQK